MKFFEGQKFTMTDVYRPNDPQWSGMGTEESGVVKAFLEFEDRWELHLKFQHHTMVIAIDKVV